MRRSLPFIYLGLNIACALAVLFASYRVSALSMAEQRDYSDSVDGITFFANSAPALVLAGLINIAWLAKAVVDVSRRHYRTLAWLGAAGVVWVLTVVVARLF